MTTCRAEWGSEGFIQWTAHRTRSSYCSAFCFVENVDPEKSHVWGGGRGEAEGERSLPLEFLPHGNSKAQ